MLEARVAVIGFVRFPPERMAEVRPHLKALVDATRRHDGCITYDAGEDPFDPGLVHFSELWPDADLLARHGKAAHIEPWRAATRACGLIERKFVAYELSGARAI